MYKDESLCLAEGILGNRSALDSVSVLNEDMLAMGA